MTKLFVEHTDYEYLPALDINSFKVNSFLNPLIVCAKEQQKQRLLRIQALGILRAKIIGYWDVGGMPMDSLLEYDAIFVLDPERITEAEPRAQWERIIQCLR